MLVRLHWVSNSEVSVQVPSILLWIDEALMPRRRSRIPARALFLDVPLAHQVRPMIKLLLYVVLELFH